MSYTAQQVLDAAIQRSDLNDPNLVPPAQALRYMSQYEKWPYIRAARVNPDYFGTNGTTSTRSDHSSSWDLDTSPGNVAAVTMAEVASITGSPAINVGDKVNLIGLRWADIDLAPRAYVRGHTITPYNDELGSDDVDFVDQLTVYYSPLPAQITTLSQSLTLPDEWMDLVIVPLAQVLAIRDGRTQAELAAYENELAYTRALFDEAVMVYDHGVRRPLVSVPAIPFPQRPQQQ